MLIKTNLTHDINQLKIKNSSFILNLLHIVNKMLYIKRKGVLDLESYLLICVK